MSQGLRFSPPDVFLTPEIRWLLAGAFGPPGQPLPPPPDRAAFVETAVLLDLVPRLVTRLGAVRLQQELGESVAGRLLAEYRDSAVRSVQLVGLARQVAAAAAGCSIPLVFLKFGALVLGGYVEPGGRGAVDVDVLVPPAQARELQAALIRSGYREADLPEHEHQLRPLVHPAGPCLEIHTVLLGVRISGKDSATAPVLENVGLLVPLGELPGKCSLPTREVLAAHALVHGLAQHGLAPRAYPLLRMAADLLDLGVLGMAENGRPDPVRRWLDRAVSPAEVDETIALCRTLASGVLAEPAQAGAAGTRLLRHILAGTFDQAYESSLRRSRVMSTLTDRSRPAELLFSLWKAVWPTRAQLDVLYPRSSGGRTAWLRLRRPFDLLWRFARRH